MTNSVTRIVAAWRDDEAFDALSDSLKQEIPSHPSGLVKLRLVNIGATDDTNIGGSTQCSTAIWNCCGGTGTDVGGSTQCSTALWDCCGR